MIAATIPTKHGNVTGVSVGGIYTSVMAQRYGVCFDVGIPLAEHVGAKILALSHCHSDHIGGLIAFLGARDLMGPKDPLTIICPEADAGLVEDVVRTGSKLGRYDMNAVVRGWVPGTGMNIGRGLGLSCFATHHPVPSLGYEITEGLVKLRPEFLGADIASLRKTQAIEDLTYITYNKNLVFVTDTNADVFATNPEIFQADVLICESTYVCTQKDQERAWKNAHVHILDVASAVKASDFQGQLILTHFSKAYSRQDIHSAILTHLPGVNVSALLHHGWD